MKAKASECCEVPGAEGVLEVNIIGRGLEVRSLLCSPGMVGVQGVSPGNLDGSSRGCHGESVVGGSRSTEPHYGTQGFPPTGCPREGCGGMRMG